MPRKSKDKDSEHISGDVIAEISDQPITDTVRTNFMPYAMYVIRERSIPEIDGGLIALTRFQGEIGFYPEEYLEIIRTYLGK